VQSSLNVGQLELTLHEGPCVLHAQLPLSTAHFSAARVAASQEPFETLQKKKRLQALLPQARPWPLAHHASHSADVATFGAGRIAVTPPCFSQLLAQNESFDPTRQLP
jgi:hypothetical protein